MSPHAGLAINEVPMHKLIAVFVLTCLASLVGCATSNEEIVKVGPDTYKMGNLGRFKDYSSGALKARLYEDAYKHCAAQNRIMVPTNAAQNAASAPAGMQFRCVARNDANLSRANPAL
jgi:hypothetical protein